MVDIKCHECKTEDTFDDKEEAEDEGWKKVKGHWLCPDCCDNQDDEEKADNDEDDEDDDDDDSLGFGHLGGELGRGSFGGGFGGASFGGGGGKG